MRTVAWARGVSSLPCSMQGYPVLESPDDLGNYSKYASNCVGEQGCPPAALQAAAEHCRCLLLSSQLRFSDLPDSPTWPPVCCAVLLRFAEMKRRMLGAELLIGQLELQATAAKCELLSRQSAISAIAR